MDWVLSTPTTIRLVTSVLPSLLIVLFHVRARYVGHRGSEPSQWRHDHAVFQLTVSQLQRLGETSCGCHGWYKVLCVDEYCLFNDQTEYVLS